MNRRKRLMRTRYCALMLGPKQRRDHPTALLHPQGHGIVHVAPPVVRGGSLPLARVSVGIGSRGELPPDRRLEHALLATTRHVDVAPVALRGWRGRRRGGDEQHLGVRVAAPRVQHLLHVDQALAADVGVLPLAPEVLGVELVVRTSAGQPDVTPWLSRPGGPLPLLLGRLLGRRGRHGVGAADLDRGAPGVQHALWPAGRRRLEREPLRGALVDPEARLLQARDLHRGRHPVGVHGDHVRRLEQLAVAPEDVAVREPVAPRDADADAWQLVQRLDQGVLLVVTVHKLLILEYSHCRQHQVIHNGRIAHHKKASVDVGTALARTDQDILHAACRVCLCYVVYSRGLFRQHVIR
mmetsp:Transcript_42119/g.117406  ORF Transcript_42119/g.117406 Transcript_42119/m.117406 type:complete len:353 (+) Transcript_42119:106-1164(+)